MSRNVPQPLAAGLRVYLRHPRKSDMDEFTRLVLVSRRFLHPWVTPATTPEAYERYLQFSRRKSMCACLVCRSEDSGIIGVCSLSQIFLGDLPRASLGYWIGAKFSGQGYMTEALNLLLAYAFETLRLHRIEADIQPENVHSKALAARTGFRIVGFFPRYLKVAGRWMDHERWAIGRKEWAKHVREGRS
jgi:ribosomal-protein-alanine N-acetyltransferase